MTAKLFDAHNKFLQEFNTSEALPTLKLTKLIPPPTEPGPYRPPLDLTTFRLIDTDESGALIYREVEDSRKDPATQGDRSGSASQMPGPACVRERGEMSIQIGFAIEASCPKCQIGRPQSYTTADLRTQILQGKDIGFYCFNCNHDWVASAKERESISRAIGELAAASHVKAAGENG